MLNTFVLDAEDIPVIGKPKGDILDYSFDWTDFLTPLGDSIASFSVSADYGVVDVQTRSGTTITAWISGGQLNRTILVACTITTASIPARVVTRYMRIKIEQPKKS